MITTRRTLAAVGVVGVLAAGAAIPAIAQDGTDDTTTEETTSDTTREERHAARQQAFAEALAAELGIDVDTVTDALEAVHEDMQATRQAEFRARVQARLDELVEAGELTQEEAETLAEVQERGVLRGELGRVGGRGHHGPRGGMPGPGADAA